jgi:hypothetical protein
LVSERFGDDVKVFAVYALFNNIGTTLSMAISLFYVYDPYLYFEVVLLLQIIVNLSLTYLKPLKEVEILNK